MKVAHFQKKNIFYELSCNLWFSLTLRCCQYYHIHWVNIIPIDFIETFKLNSIYISQISYVSKKRRSAVNGDVDGAVSQTTLSGK